MINSVYEEGRFCETFHSNENGWRKRVACGKRVHCGCVVSINTIILLETFGVACLNCAMNTSTIAPNQCDSPSWSTTLAESVHNTSSPCEVEESNNSDKVNGSKCEANAVAKSGQKGLDAKYQPRISDHELQQISRDLNSVVTPLFEKTLTISDADYKLGRLVIPKKCAQEYFPLISGPEGVTIRILDTRGREWVFHYRYWSNANSQMYVLDGLKDFVISMQWQAGDVVTFYRIEPKGQLVLGLRKASVTPPSHKTRKRLHLKRTRTPR
eukprot:XP_019072962.1 PREDICTED: B3 domain-containing protein Os07g0563300 isoform X3 [Vitis vinifera]